MKYKKEEQLDIAKRVYGREMTVSKAASNFDINFSSEFKKQVKKLDVGSLCFFATQEVLFQNNNENFHGNQSKGINDW